MPNSKDTNDRGSKQEDYAQPNSRFLSKLPQITGSLQKITERGDYNYYVIFHQETILKRVVECGYIPKKYSQHLSPIFDYKTFEQTFDIQAKINPWETQIKLTIDIKISQNQYKVQIPIKIQRCLAKLQEFQFKQLPISQQNQIKLSQLSQYQSSCQTVINHDQPSETMNNPQLQLNNEREKNYKYIRNFELALLTMKKYSHIFEQNEIEIIQKYLALSTNAKIILTRMYTRKVIWFSREHIEGYFKNEVQISLQLFLSELEKIGLIENCKMLFQMKESVEDEVKNGNSLYEFIDSLKLQQLKNIKGGDLARLKSKMRSPFELYRLQPIEIHQRNPFAKAYISIDDDDDQQNDQEIKDIEVNSLKIRNECSKILTKFKLMQQQEKKQASIKQIQSKKGKLNYSNTKGKQEQSNESKKYLLSHLFNLIFKLINNRKNVLEHFNSKQLLKSGELKSTTLQSFFTKVSNDKQKKQPKSVREEVYNAIIKSLNGLHYYRILYKARHIFTKSLRLFFSFQQRELMDTLIKLDYGLVRFQNYKNYVNWVIQMQRFEETGFEEEDQESKYLFPLFQQRQDFIKYNNAYSLYESLFQLSEMKYKNRELEYNISWNICKNIIQTEFIAQTPPFNILLITEKIKSSNLIMFFKSFIEQYQHKKKKVWKQNYVEVFCIKQRFTPKYKYAGLLYQCVQYIERMGSQYLKACYVLMTLLLTRNIKINKRPQWWHRLLVNMTHHLKVKDLELIQRIANNAIEEDPQGGGMRAKILQMLSKFESKQQKKVKTKNRQLEEVKQQKINKTTQAIQHPINRDYCYNRILKARQTRIHGGFVYITRKQVMFQRVQELAMHYYSKHQGMKALHVENSLMRHLFGLFFWNQIYFDKIPYLFQTPYQGAPLDFGLKDVFYFQRRDIFQNKVRQILKMTGQQKKQIIAQTYDQKKGIKNPLIDWQSKNLQKETLQQISALVENQVLVEVFERLMKNLSAWSHGWPDLVVWNSKICKFVEVKSQNDRLSDQQKCWLSVLSNLKQKVEVCYVNDQDEGFDVLNKY